MPEKQLRLAIGTWLTIIAMLIAGVAWVVTQSARISALEVSNTELLLEVRAAHRDWLAVAVRFETLGVSLARMEAQQAIHHQSEGNSRAKP